VFFLHIDIINSLPARVLHESLSVLSVELEHKSHNVILQQ